MANPVVVAVAAQADVERIRRAARDLALANGAGPVDAECVAIAVSELATNLVRYARAGEIEASIVRGPRGTGIRIDSRDQGPGIPDVAAAMRDGYSSGGGLGGGLPGVVRLMDDFEIRSGPSGTHVTARKWLTVPS